MGCQSADGAATVWSDFRVRPDGFTHILVLNHCLRATQAGRLVQRLLNIETYRLMAMLAFPLARQNRRRNHADRKPAHRSDPKICIRKLVWNRTMPC